MSSLTSPPCDDCFVDPDQLRPAAKHRPQLEPAGPPSNDDSGSSSSSGSSSGSSSSSGDQGAPAAPTVRDVFLPAVSLSDSDVELPRRLIFGPLVAPCSDVSDAEDADADSGLPAAAAAAAPEREGAGINEAASEAVTGAGCAPAEAESRPTGHPPSGRPPGAPPAASGRPADDAACTACGSAHAPEHPASHPHGAAAQRGHGQQQRVPHGVCLIVRPPVPPSGELLPVVDELAQLVQEHVLQPVAGAAPAGAGGEVEGEREAEGVREAEGGGQGERQAKGGVVSVASGSEGEDREMGRGGGEQEEG